MNKLTPHDKLPSLCAWCPDKEQREEALAKQLGMTRAELMKVLSHGICQSCTEILKDEAKKL